MKEWLSTHYRVDYEVSLPRRRRLDAAIQLNEGSANDRNHGIDIAVEWEWDNNKVATDFLRGDYRKLFCVNARCGLAIIQTRTDGRRGSDQADQTIRDLQRLNSKYRRDSRPVGIFEIRRTLQGKGRVDFVCYYHEFDEAVRRELRSWGYP